MLATVRLSGNSCEISIINGFPQEIIHPFNVVFIQSLSTEKYRSNSWMNCCSVASIGSPARLTSKSSFTVFNSFLFSGTTGKKRSAGFLKHPIAHLATNNTASVSARKDSHALIVLKKTTRFRLKWCCVEPKHLSSFARGPISSTIQVLFSASLVLMQSFS